MLTTNTPPNGSFNVPLIHKLDEFYQKLYVLNRRLNKSDKLGIWLKIENMCLEILELVISAALQAKNTKINFLNPARIKIEILKRLIRTAAELKIIEPKNYLDLETNLQEISKMANGWIKFLND